MEVSQKCSETIECPLCQKVLSNTRQLTRHKNIVHEGGYLTCLVCEKVLKNKFQLWKHKRNVHNIKTGAKTKSLIAKCMEIGCGEHLCSVNELRVHLKSEHKLDHMANEYSLTFKSSLEFEEWLMAEELKNNVSFIKSSVHQCKYYTSCYYICNRSGMYKATGCRVRQLKAQGSRKMGFACTAGVIVKAYNDYIDVKYHDQHYQHDFSSDHLSTSGHRRLSQPDISSRFTRYCGVKSCKNTSVNCQLTLFRFPGDPTRAAEWKEQLGQFNLTKRSQYVCGDHFETKFFTNNTKNRLRLDAIPTIQNSLLQNVEQPVQLRNVEQLCQLDNVEQLSQMENVEQISQMENVEKISQMENVEQISQLDNVEQISQMENVEHLVQLENVKELSQTYHVDSAVLRIPSISDNDDDDVQDSSSVLAASAGNVIPLDDNVSNKDCLNMQNVKEMKFLKEENNRLTSHVKDLEHRLKKSEERAKTLEKALAAVTNGTTIVIMPSSSI